MVSSAGTMFASCRDRGHCSSGCLSRSLPRRLCMDRKLIEWRDGLIQISLTSSRISLNNSTTIHYLWLWAWFSSMVTVSACDRRRKLDLFSCVLVAILAYRVFRDVQKIYVKILHASLLASSLIFSTIGLIAVFDNHNLSKPPKANMYSLHSWIGLSAVILFGLQWVFGFVFFLFPKLSEDFRQAYMPR